MSAAILEEVVITHQHCVIEVAQKPPAYAGLDAHQRPCTKADIIQVTATATKVTIRGVGAAKAAIQ